MSLQLTKTILAFLQSNPGKRFTARDIATWIVNTYPDKVAQKQKKSTATVTPLDSDQAILQQIVAEISAQRPRMQQQYPKIKTTEGRPRKYYFTDASDEYEVQIAEGKANISTQMSDRKDIKEKDLYPLLSDFLRTELNIYTKRIDEKRSKNSRGLNGNKWLHPDLVGIENLSQDWETEVKNCVKESRDTRAKLWSFEVKILINSSNLREAFFQAVSNSSWANFGYLVASEIAGTDTFKELRILSSLHGIGFIEINSDDISKSQITIPARERNEIDWDTINRIAQENKDFLDYIELIRHFYQTGDLKKNDWNYSHFN